jgi:TetR/AcrR family transcriptional regulator, cholesterol catabolism regulator
VADDLARQIVVAKSAKRDTKELIYEHAITLFAARSYARTGLRDISRAVGIEVASLYTHIGSKNALLFDIMEYGTMDLLQRLTSAQEQVSSDPLLRFFTLIREHVAFCCRYRSQTIVVFDEIRELSPAQREQIMRIREQIESLYIRCVKDGIASGEVRDVNIHITVNGIISMIHGVAGWFRDDGPMTAEQMGEAYADLALRGLLRKGWLARFEDKPIDLPGLTAMAV